jgi:hypothetical protein
MCWEDNDYEQKTDVRPGLYGLSRWKLWVMMVFYHTDTDAVTAVFCCLLLELFGPFVQTRPIDMSLTLSRHSCRTNYSKQDAMISISAKIT